MAEKILYYFGTGMIQRQLLFFVLAMTCGTSAFSQDYGELKLRATPPASRDSVLRVFHTGSFHGSFRYYFMSTINDGALVDYYANAVGGSLSYGTKPFHHFSAGVSVGYAFNFGSSNLTKPDGISGSPNRYEVALFDLTDPSKANMARLEELYLKYSFAKGFVQFGKLGALNTPFINPQDGFMRPTIEEGLWARFVPAKNMQLQGGWLFGFSPCSTYRWYDAGRSVGLYFQGVNPDGSKSAYLNNVESPGVGIIHFTGANGAFTYGALEQFAANLFNTASLTAGYTLKPFKNGSRILLSAQAFRQDAVADGGNEDSKKTYFPKGASSWIFSGQAKWASKGWEASLNATRITKDGRYLAPREWGRDPFYTFLPRERNEGFGDVTAIVAKAAHKLPKKGFSTEFAIGHYTLPDVTNFALNKYGQPSYSQINAEVLYAFSGSLKGFETLLIYGYKKNEGDLHDNPKFEDNKVNMWLINLVLNFKF